MEWKLTDSPVKKNFLGVAVSRLLLKIFKVLKRLITIDFFEKGCNCQQCFCQLCRQYSPYLLNDPCEYTHTHTCMHTYLPERTEKKGIHRFLDSIADNGTQIASNDTRTSFCFPYMNNRTFQNLTIWRLLRSDNQIFHSLACVISRYAFNQNRLHSCYYAHTRNDSRWRFTNGNIWAYVKLYTRSSSSGEFKFALCTYAHLCQLKEKKFPILWAIYFGMFLSIPV